MKRITPWSTSCEARARKRKASRPMRVALAAAWLLAAAPLAAQTGSGDGPSLYAAHCTRCHDGGSPRVPSRTTIAQLTPERVVVALETGTMHTQGASLG